MRGGGGVGGGWGLRVVLPRQCGLLGGGEGDLLVLRVWEREIDTDTHTHTRLSHLGCGAVSVMEEVKEKAGSGGEMGNT